MGKVGLRLNLTLYSNTLLSSLKLGLFKYELIFPVLVLSFECITPCKSFVLAKAEVLCTIKEKDEWNMFWLGSSRKVSYILRGKNVVQFFNVLKGVVGCFRGNYIMETIRCEGSQTKMSSNDF